MCANGRCCCLKLETATLILAIINSVAMIAAAAIGIVQVVKSYDHFENSHISASLYTFGFITFGVSAVKFVFSVVLCFGITKKNLLCLKLFMLCAVLAIVANIVTIVSMVVAMIKQHSRYTPIKMYIIPSLYPLSFAIFTMLLLVMVGLTHRKMAKEVY